MSDPPRHFDDDEPVTSTLCLACGGDNRRVVETHHGYRTEVCPHCTEGAMSPRQEVEWRTRRKA